MVAIQRDILKNFICWCRWTSVDEKKPGTKSTAARHLMGTTFISKLTATLSRNKCQIGLQNPAIQDPKTPAPAFCVQDVGSDMGLSINKQKNKQTSVQQTSPFCNLTYSLINIYFLKIIIGALLPIIRLNVINLIYVRFCVPIAYLF